MLAVDFNDLPQLTRSRFITATQTPAARVAFYPSGRGGALGWGCLLAGAGLPLPLFLIAGAVQPEDNFKRTGAVFFIAIFAFFAVLAALGFARTRAVKKSYPFALGSYVFPTQIVLAPSNILSLYSLAELIDVAIVNHYVNGAYQTSTVTCTFKSGPNAVLNGRGIQEAHHVQAALLRGKQTLLTALANRDFESLRPIDPFFEAQMTNFAKVSEPGPTVAPLPKWTGGGVRFLVSLGASALLTGLVLLVRLVVGAAGDDPDTSATHAPRPATTPSTAPTPTAPPPTPTAPPAKPPPATPTAKKKPGAR